MSPYLHTKHQSCANFELHKVVAANAGRLSDTSRAKVKLLRLVGSVRPLVSHYIQQVLAKYKTRRHSLASRNEETNVTASAAGAFACALHHTKCLFVHKKNAGLTYTKKPGPLQSDTRVNAICKADATTVSSYAQTIRNTSQQVIKPHQRKNSERFQTSGSERTHKDSLAALGAHCDITLGSVRVWLARAQVS